MLIILTNVSGSVWHVTLLHFPTNFKSSMSFALCRGLHEKPLCSTHISSSWFIAEATSPCLKYSSFVSETVSVEITAFLILVGYAQSGTCTCRRLRIRYERIFWRECISTKGVLSASYLYIRLTCPEPRLLCSIIALRLQSLTRPCVVRL